MFALLLRLLMAAHSFLSPGSLGQFTFRRVAGWLAVTRSQDKISTVWVCSVDGQVLLEGNHQFGSPAERE